MPHSPFRPRGRFVAPLLLALALAGLPLEAAFTVAGRRLLRDGTPFFVQGVCYQPTPVGKDNAAEPPYGDYYTAEYGPLLDRDLPNLRALGANVLRLYGWNSAADHSAFLDRCYDNGRRPLFVLLNLWIDPATNWNDPAAVAAIAAQYVALETNVANHPAVLGIAIGNEVNARDGNGAKPAFWAAMNSVARAIKTANPARLVSIAVTDAVAQVQAFDTAVPAIDFWSLQIYRHPTFGTFFAEYRAASAKPLLVSEFGLDAYDHANGREYPDRAALAGERVASLWREIQAAGSGPAPVCSGGCVFEYSDEWYKADTASWMRWQHDPGGWAAAGFPDGWADEEWWGLYAVTPAGAGTGTDTLAPRAAVAQLTALWTAPPVAIRVPPTSHTATLGTAAALTVVAEGGGTLTYQWCKGGRPIVGATGPSLPFAQVAATDAGLYDVLISGTADQLSRPAVLGILPPAGERTAGTVETRTEWQNIHHPNGHIYDQFLLSGTAGTFTADPGEIARLSFLDPADSIVQVEMSGAGAITVVLEDATGPAAPALYNQSGIRYMKGKPTVILAGADTTTHFTIYSVGTATNPGVTRPDAAYAGWADIAVAGIVATDGKLGGIHQGNVRYGSATGYTGIHASNVSTVGGLAVVHDILAQGPTIPLLYFADAGTVALKIAGGALAQPNGAPVIVRGIAEVRMGAGQDSCGRPAAAHAIGTDLLDDAGTDVTDRLVVPGP